MADKSVDAVIKIMLAVFLGSILLPVAFSNWFTANQSGWSGGVKSLWPVIPIMALIGILYMLYKQYV